MLEALGGLVTIEEHMSSESAFSIVPIELIQDKRLAFRHTKVMIAILSFRGRNTDLVWPSREKIAERCGMDVNRISAVTTELVELGWLQKEGDGGRSRPCRYWVTVPDLETLTDPVTLTDSVTLTDFDQNPYRFGKETLTDSVRGKELTKNIPEVTILSGHSEETQQSHKPKKAHQLPSDFDLSDSRIAFFRTRLPQGNAEDEFLKFTSYHQAKGSTMKDWDAAWRTWVLNAATYSNRSKTNGNRYAHPSSRVFADAFKGVHVPEF